MGLQMPYIHAYSRDGAHLPTIPDVFGQDVERHYCERSLYVLPKSSWIRRTLMLITHTKLFELVVLLAIAANCITLALDRCVWD